MVNSEGKMSWRISHYASWPPLFEIIYHSFLKRQKSGSSFKILSYPLTVACACIVIASVDSIQVSRLLIFRWPKVTSERGRDSNGTRTKQKSFFFFGLVPNLGLTLSKTKLSLGLIRVYIASIIFNLSSNLFELVYNVTKGLLIR